MLSMTCHGEASTEGESFLHLADGLVPSAALIGELALGGLPVAVIPACKTGMSLEGALGYEEYRALDSAFLMMGASKVISSFFPVQDEATFRIMEKFHKNIKNGAPPVEALHMAQRAIMGMGLPEGSHPGKIGFSKRRRKKEGKATDEKSRTADAPVSGIHPYYWAFLKVSGVLDPPDGYTARG